MKQKDNCKKVSIGIAALNEGRRIRSVLESIINQHQLDWEIEEILLYSDGSTDNTVTEAKKVADPRIKIIHDQTRRGKTFRLNQMFRRFKGRYLIMFDGDIIIKETNVISNLLTGFNEKNVVLVGGNSTTLPPKSFFERAVNTTFHVFYESRKKIKDGHNVFGCTGSILAIEKKFAKSVTIPKIINEDTYLYFYCLTTGKKFRYIDTAKIYYQLPSKLTDYLRQLFRSAPEAVNVELEKYFGPLVEAEFRRPKTFYAKEVFRSFANHPLETSFIILVNILAKPLYQVVTRNYRHNWSYAASTH